jgi:hypothetical protein
LVNISVGSLPGTSGLEATTVWPLDAKKSRKLLRMSATEKGVALIFGNPPGGHGLNPLASSAADGVSMLD